jgi:hypothetical protein
LKSTQWLAKMLPYLNKAFGTFLLMIYHVPAGVEYFFGGLRAKLLQHRSKNAIKVRLSETLDHTLSLLLN